MDCSIIFDHANEEAQKTSFKNWKWTLPAVLILSLVFIYFIPRFIMYSYYPLIGWLVFVFIFFFIPALIFINLAMFTDLKKMNVALTFASPLIIGPTFGLFQSYREKLELDKNGRSTKAVVIDRKYSTGRGSRHWLIKCRYSINSKNYETGYNDDLENTYQVGDIISLMYSSDFPEIYALKTQ